MLADDEFMRAATGRIGKFRPAIWLKNKVGYDAASIAGILDRLNRVEKLASASRLRIKLMNRDVQRLNLYHSVDDHR